MIVKIVKIYLGLSLVLLWAVWGQFIFGQFLGPAYISQDLLAPSYVVGTNYRVFIYCTCHFQGGSLCFSFFCLLVSSMSDFCPDTRGRWWTLFLGSLVQSRCGEGGTLLSKTMVCFSGYLMSSASIQKLFVKFIQRLSVLLMNLWGRKWPLHPIPLPSQDCLHLKSLF